MSTPLVLFSCVIHSANIRVLAAATTCMSRVGREVVVDAASEGHLTFRCLNDAKTSFLSFELNRPFFEEFFLRDGDVVAKLAIRNLQTIFRTLRTMERLEIKFEAAGVRHLVSFRTTCKSGIVKTHQFHYEAGEAMEAAFDRENAVHRFKARPALLTEVLHHVHNSEEIFLTARAGLDVQIASRVGVMQKTIFKKEREEAGRGEMKEEDETKGRGRTATTTTTTGKNKNSTVTAAAALAKNALITEMTVPASDFDEFLISDPITRLVFPLREFRSVLQFCEMPGMHVDAVGCYFNNPGEPLLVTTSTVDPSAPRFNAPPSQGVESQGVGGGTHSMYSSSSAVDALPEAVPLFTVSLVMATLMLPDAASTAQGEQEAVFATKDEGDGGIPLASDTTQLREGERRVVGEGGAERKRRKTGEKNEDDDEEEVRRGVGRQATASHDVSPTLPRNGTVSRAVESRETKSVVIQETQYPDDDEGEVDFRTHSFYQNAGKRVMNSSFTVGGEDDDEDDNET